MALEDTIRSLITEIGEDPKREGLLKTPSRVADSMRFFTQGYGQRIQDILNGALFS